ncbi:MAG: cytochrome-c oxidase, cbb3-type subunit III, partial [Alphaproteobacteria bacterium CG11_big_fil_rev_8_21_14_0_20_44_7]
MSDEKNKEIDKHSGVETTGHEWDGIKELNNPAPRWWLWVFFVCVIWSIGYWVLYPAWPTISGEGERGGTAGTKEWTQYKKLEEEQAEIRARKAKYLERFHNANFEEIANDSALYEFALAGGKAAFKDNCATCHGTGGAGSAGYPNLNDDDWIWGGNTEEIYQTLKYGIRSGHDDARYSQMPAFKDVLTSAEISQVADYVLN